MNLLTQAQRNNLPKLYDTEHEADALALVKFFTPWTNWTWYAVEFDGEDRFFGLVCGFVREMGYFSLQELQAIRGPGGLTIERDAGFDPTPLSQLS